MEVKQTDLIKFTVATTLQLIIEWGGTILNGLSFLGVESGILAFFDLLY